MTSRLPLRRLARLALASLLLLAAGAAAAEPRSGRYQARQGQFEGWIEIEVEPAPFPGSEVVVRIVADELSSWPLSSSLRPSDLQPTAGAGDATLSHPGQGWDPTTLDFWWFRDETLLLRSSYSVRCCRPGDFEIVHLLLDFVGPSGAKPALRPVDGGFRITAEWRDGHGGGGVGTPVALDHRSGTFWFFRSDNPELLVKLIDACEPFGRWWFFAAGLTDLEVEITVEGPTGVRTYFQPQGKPFPPILDTDAFPCADPGGG